MNSGENHLPKTVKQTSILFLRWNFDVFLGQICHTIKPKGSKNYFNKMIKLVETGGWSTNQLYITPSISKSNGWARLEPVESVVEYSILVSKPPEYTQVFVCLEIICTWCLCQPSKIPITDPNDPSRSFCDDPSATPNANHQWAQKINRRSRFVVGFVASSIGPGGLHHRVQSTRG